MEITEHTPNVLIVHQGAWLTRLAGAVAAIVGGCGLILLHSAPAGSVQGSIAVGYIVCTVFLAFGAVFFAQAADERVVFDRTAGVVRVIARGVRRRTVTEYPLASVRDVALQARVSEHFMEYRPVLVLRDGRLIPWTWIMTSATRRQAQCVTAARTFGGWQGATSALPLAPVSGGIGVPRGNVILGGLLLGAIACAGLAIYGLEVYRLVTWRPVPATVMSSAIATVSEARGGTSYRPAISYWYRVDGARYVATGVTPITISQGRAWAASLSARFPVGAQVTAYVDPKRPGMAFLIHEASLLPLWFVVIAAAMAAGLALAVRHTNQSRVGMASDLGVPVVSRSVPALG